MTLLHETERGFTDWVVECAQTFGFLVHHDRPARTDHGWRTAIQGDAGFPDVLALGYGRLIVAELKVGRNTMTDRQASWMWRFGQLADDRWHIEAHVWRPSDKDEIEACFKRRGKPQ